MNVPRYSSSSRRGFRLSALFAVLMLGTIVSKASNPWINVINGQITPENPYLEYELMMYDANGKDSYYDTSNDPNNYPGIMVDGDCFASDHDLWWLLCWDDWGRCSDNIAGINGYWGLWKSDDGKVTIQAYDPHRSNDRMYISFKITFAEEEVGRTHTIDFIGRWHNDRGGAQWKVTSVTSDPTVDVFGDLGTISRVGDKTIQYKGSLKNYSKYHYNLGFYKKAVSKPVGNSNAWLYKTLNSGTTSAPADTRWTVYDNNNSVDVYPFFEMQREEVSYGQVKYAPKFYKSYSKQTLPGMAYPTSFTSTPDMWKKTVVLTWGAVDNDREKNGTWTIYRRKKGESENNRTVVVQNLSFATRSYTDSNAALEYDTDYLYEVEFVPKDYDGSKVCSDLTASVITNILRRFEFTNLKVDSGEKSLTFSWNNPAFLGTESYSFKVLRSEDGGEWKELTTISVSDKSRTSYSYTDNNIPSACPTYTYKVIVTMLGGKIFEPDSTKLPSGNIWGSSRVTAMEASKGDYSGMVKISWDAEQVSQNATNYVLFRRIIGSGSAWASIYKTSGTAESYFFEDNTALPGQYYEYKVESSFICDGTYTSPVSVTDDGFCRSTGIISGRISYGTGTAVPGVKVTLIKSNDNSISTSQFYSLRTTGTGDGVRLSLTDDELKENFTDQPFSMQMYVRPDKNQSGSSPVIFDIADKFQLTLGTLTSKGFPVYVTYRPSSSASNLSTGLVIAADQFTSVNVVKNADQTYRITLINEAGQTTSYTTKALSLNYQGTANNLGICFGGPYTSAVASVFQGYVDEMRLFRATALTAEDIANNYNHTLSGNENGLFLYWPVDEGIANQTIAYDYSKTDGVANSHHGKLGGGTTPTSGVLPTNDQLSLFAFTDVQGNYVIRGVPFSGEGTNYTVIPSLGIHEFSPNYSSRYVSASSLIHSGVDFTDVSSFPVRGTVYYEHTTYPVEGCNFYVDGTLCCRDGEVITTEEDGTFTISVPIGRHSITIAKKGHTFVNNGRYPADPMGTGQTLVFDREVNNLEFLDNTVLNFTGHVVGGSIEGSKQIGFGLSNNNIGVTEIVLSPMNDNYRMNVVKEVTATSYSYETNTATLPCASARSSINSTSWRGAGEYNKKFYIRTDPATGEFSALLPPLVYQIESMKVVSTGVSVGEPTTVDISNPVIEYTDTLHNDLGMATDIYTYNSMLNVTYHTDPVFTVTQDGRTDGSFGINSYSFEDVSGKFTVKDIYSVQAGKVTYKYGAPLFVKEDPYVFIIKGYEEYVNSDDKSKPVTDHVPLSGNVVTIENALSSTQSVYIEDGTTDDGRQVKAGDVVELLQNQIQLDSLGHATYKWKAGYPNIVKPYTRTINIYYDIDGRTYTWSGNGMTGIVLGGLPTGNNFVTSGPDKLSMILRDPPGSGSSASWSQGTTTSWSHHEGGVWKQEASVITKWQFGVNIGVIKGTPGTGTLDVVTTKDDLNGGLKESAEGENSTTWAESTTVTRTISTSDDPEFDGADGDVFIGHATNLLFGKARNVGFKRVSESTVELALEEMVTTGLSFGTSFQYTQKYIKETLLPNYDFIKRSLLQTVSAAAMASYKNNTDHVVYLTTLSPDDPRFGTGNNDECWGDEATKASSSKGPSYTAFAPSVVKEGEALFDSIVWINNQISNWKSYLEFNEKEKVLAYEDRDKYLSRNLSFDGGAGYSFSEAVTKDTTYTKDWQVMGCIVVENTFGSTLSGFGCDVTVNDETGGGRHNSTDSIFSHTTTFEYRLAEQGEDAITVDVLKYGDYSPIFRTRGGQTSAPYEGEVKTEYYRPGTTIMEATMQIEVPDIEVDEPSVTDVPSGSAANYTLRLMNATETGSDVTYRLSMIDETNPNGAQLSIDGKVLTESRLIKVNAGETLTKSLQLRQTNTSVLDYNRIGIVFATQYGDAADTVYISAQFVPSSSEVTLALDHTVLNTFTGDNLGITFKDFDRNYNNLKAFRIQYRQQGDTEWTLVREYVLNQKNVTGSNQLLPAGANVTYTLPMHSFSDGDYIFRVLSVATYGASEVTRPSQEITVTKDMARPRPLIMPSPSDGILNAGDEISILFNEDLRSSALNAADNFMVTADLNDATVAHDGVFAVSGGEGARTSATINLSNRPFAFGFWLKWSKAGTIVSHGTAASPFSISIDAGGHIVVANGAMKHTSATALPADTWCYVGVSMDCKDDKTLLSGGVAYDIYTRVLFDEVETDVYTGKGILTVGQGITAAIHELTLWNYARTFNEAQGNMYTGKSASSDGLIGYWKLDEGHGTLGQDHARSRHLTLPSIGCWHMAADNIALALDGKSYAGFNVSGATGTNDDDWMVEFWLKGAMPTAKATLLSFGNGDLDLNATAAGNLELIAGTTTATMAAADLFDGNWHHIALNVLHGSSGSATLYIDGQPISSLAASALPAFQSDRVYLGAKRSQDGGSSYSQFFTGSFDEFRCWCGTFSRATIDANRYVRLSGNEPGLKAYYPFEKQSLDDYNQIIVTKDKADHAAGSKMKAEIYNTSNAEPAWESKAAPALKTAPSAENVPFSFVANERQIVITLESSAVRLEGSTVSFTVRDVLDRNGNACQPVTWTAYVQQNRLMWSDSEVAIRKEGTSDVTFNMDIINTSGSTENWAISGLPVWLSASSESGTLSATGSRTITFTVAGSTPTGTYEGIIGLTGNNGVTRQLIVNLTCVSEKPAWSADITAYEHTMNAIGQISIDGIFSNDEEDLVAAFIDGECRGVASPAYFTRYDACFVMLTIGGNTDDEGKEVVFKVFDNSTGNTYPSVICSQSVSFSIDGMAGDVEKPVLWTPDNRQEQTMAYTKGWNWMSLYVTPTDSSVSAVFKSAVTSLATVKDKTSFANATSGKWSGSLTTLSPDGMYKVKADVPVNVDVIGIPADPTKRPITIASGWNWIGFNGTAIMAVDEAFAGLEPTDGDVVKSQNAFSIYNDYAWVGTLTTMEPGKGYIYRSMANGNRTFTYPKSSSTNAVAHAPVRSGEGTEAEYYPYASVMCVIAQVTDGPDIITNATIRITASGEQRGLSTAAVADGLHFINVQGEGFGTPLDVYVEIDGKVWRSSTPLVFNEDEVLGTAATPIRLNIGNVTSMTPVTADDAHDAIYDVLGRRVVRPVSGFYIRGDKTFLMK